eukprot:snap_masked-scaffold_29-processed-gene-1.29-mRNA-1 protein AED:1.00 eAED:1.00 QI:0/-1/0/0/-1/1/1/0/93
MLNSIPGAYQNHCRTDLGDIHGGKNTYLQKIQLETQKPANEAEEETMERFEPETVKKISKLTYNTTLKDKNDRIDNLYYAMQPNAENNNTRDG